MERMACKEESAMKQGSLGIGKLIRMLGQRVGVDRDGQGHHGEPHSGLGWS